MFSSCACAMCLRTVSEYWKRSPQMRQCHWSRAKMYGRHSGLFGSSLGLGIFKSCNKNRNYHSDRADYDSDDRASPAACHGFREVAKSGAQPEPARLRRLCVAPAFGLRPRARLRPRLCTKLVTCREDQSASSERLYNLLVVGRPLQLSRWVEAVPGSTGRLTWKNPLADRRRAIHKRQAHLRVHVLTQLIPPRSALELPVSHHLKIHSADQLGPMSLGGFHVGHSLLQSARV